jgi:hypothetical protein
MIAQEQIIVSGKIVRLRPYTERRMKQLLEVQGDINKYVEKHPDMSIDEIDRKMVAKWWKRKADILWECDEELPVSFFESEDFEITWLRKTEDFFLNSRIYL